MVLPDTLHELERPWYGVRTVVRDAQVHHVCKGYTCYYRGANTCYYQGANSHVAVELSRTEVKRHETRFQALSVVRRYLLLIFF